MHSRFTLLVILTLMLSACTPPAAPAAPTLALPSATLAPSATHTAQPGATSTPAPTATPIPTTRVPDFSGLGSGKIVFASQHYNPAAELSVVDLKTGRVMRLIGNLFADNLYPSLSPDGTQVAFASYFNGNFELFLLNVDERTLADFPEDLEETLEPMDWLEKLGIKQLTQTPYDEKYPAWSPDGKSLVYVEEMASKADLFILPVAGGPAVQFTQNLYVNAPDWSPDGQKIVFEDWTDGGGVDIAWVPAAGGERRKLVNTLGVDEESPAWSPDGSKIAFCLAYDQQAEIALMAADGSAIQRLTNNPARECRPGWSPDGGRIVFVSERGGYPNLFVMDANGGNVRQLTFYDRRNLALEAEWGR